MDLLHHLLHVRLLHVRLLLLLLQLLLHHLHDCQGVQNINNFDVSDGEVIRPDLIDETVLSLKRNVRYAAAGDFRFYADELDVSKFSTLTSAAASKPMLQAAQAMADLQTPYGPTCYQLPDRLPSGKIACFATSPLSSGNCMDSVCSPLGDLYCQSWNYDGMADNLDNGDLVYLAKRFQNLVSSGNMTQRYLKLKMMQTSSAVLRWCQGLCSSMTTTKSVNKVNTTSITFTNTKYIVNATTPLLVSFGYFSSATPTVRLTLETTMAPLCIKNSGYSDPGVNRSLSSLVLPMIFTNSTVGTSLKSPSNTDVYSSANYFLLGNTLLSTQQENLTRHFLVLPRTRRLRRPIVSLYYACGSRSSLPLDPRLNCKLQLSAISSSAPSSPLSTAAIGSPFGDTNTTSAAWNNVWMRAPYLTPDSRLQLEANFSHAYGDLGLDDVKMLTQQKCFPKWIRVAKSGFLPNLDPSLFQPSLDNFEQSGVGPTQLDEKHALGTVTAVTLERCARLCRAGSGCDVFEYSAINQTCRFLPHTPLKDFLWSQFATGASTNKTSMYVLSCSFRLENVLPDNDHQFLPSPLWNTNSNCIGPTLWTPGFGAVDTIPAVYHGGHARMRSFNCNPVPLGLGIGLSGLLLGPAINVVTETNLSLSNFPAKMNQEYLDAVTPTALVQTWVYINQSASPIPNIELQVGSILTKTFTSSGGFVYVGMVVPQVGDFTDSVVKLTVSGGSNQILVAPLEVLVDLPLPLGCFNDTLKSISWTNAHSDPMQTPANCLTYCLQQSFNLSLAFLSRGGLCQCSSAISAKLEPLPEELCTTPCSGDPNQMCGDATSGFISAYVATCPNPDENRFGEYCYSMATADNSYQDVSDNEESCAAKDSHLWWPDNHAEVAFVTGMYSVFSVLHVGYRIVTKGFGLIHSDYSVGTGLYGYTDSSNYTLPVGDSYMTLNSCIVLNTSTLPSLLQVLSPCAPAGGICKRKLGVGYGYGNVIAGTAVSISTSASTDPNFDPVAGAVNVSLKSVYYESSRFLEVRTAMPMVLSGFLLQSPPGMRLNKFRVEFNKWSVLYPNVSETVESEPGKPLVFNVAGVFFPSSVVSRTVLLPHPIETSRFRLVVEKGDEVVQLQMQPLGMTSTGRYQLNPYFDAFLMPHEYGADNLTTQRTWYNLDQYLVVSGGSFLCDFVIGSRNAVPAARSGDNATTVFELKLRDVSTFSLTLTFRLLVSNGSMIIYVNNEIGFAFGPFVELGPFRNNPTYNQHVEVFLQVQQTGVALFINGAKVNVYTKLMTPNTFPTFAGLVWWLFGTNVTKLRVTGGNNLGPTPFFGYTPYNSMNPSTNIFLPRISDPAILLREHNAVIQTFAGPGDGGSLNYGYIPFQMLQTCYHAPRGNVRCFPSGGQFTTANQVSYGYGGGNRASITQPCPQQFSYMGTAACIVPILKKPVAYSAAVSACAAANGQSVFFPAVEEGFMANLMFREAMKSRITSNTSLVVWIGLGMSVDGLTWQMSNDKTLGPITADWAPGQPIPDGSCVVADQALGFRWRVADCGEQHPYFCAMRVPNCPEGYTFRSWISSDVMSTSRSCFKVTDFGSYNDGNMSFNSAMIGDAMCRKDGTRLVVPLSDYQRGQIRSWMVASNATTSNQTKIWLGVRGFDNVTMVTAKEYSPESDLVLNYDGNNNCYSTSLGNISATNSTPCSYNNNSPIYGLCEKRECLTVGSSYCAFPFRYNGRLYDTCVTVGNSDAPWCSTKTDENATHIPGQWAACLASCEVNNCPVGFYRNYMDDSCYQVSADHPDESAGSAKAAAELCRAQGARLWEPRTVSSLTSVLDTDLFPGQFQWSNNSITFTGMYMNATDDAAMAAMFYSGSSSPVSRFLQQHFVWDSGFPNYSMNHSCVVIHRGKFRNVVCDGYYNGLTANASKVMAGYVCEARPVNFAGGILGTCQFPVRGDNVTFDSCFPAEGAPPAPNAVQSVLTCDAADMVRGNEFTGVCTNEQLIAYDGGAQGQFCNLPFLLNREYFLTCSRTGRSGEDVGFYWCPSQDSVDPMTLEWTGNHSDPDSFGLCSEQLDYLDQDCDSNYESIGQYCVRVSSYPETYSAASLRCESEGSTLAFVPDLPSQKRLELLIAVKRQLYPKFFPSIEQRFWLGAAPTDDGGDWKWDSTEYRVPMGQYMNWKNGQIGYGCPSGNCSQALYGMVMVTNTGLNKWQAEDKTLPRPYICSANCLAGFRWYTALQKCIRVVTDRGTRISAGTNLVTMDNCTDLDLLRQELLNNGYYPGDEFFVGQFYLPITNVDSKRRRSSVSVDPVMDTYGYASPGLNFSVLGFCDAAANMTTMPDLSKEHFISLKLDAVKVIMAHYDMENASVVYGTLKGFIQEADVLQWSCPPGYSSTGKLTEDCVRLVLTEMSQLDAQQFCQADGSTLVRPQTYFDLHVLYAYLQATLAIYYPRYALQSNVFVWTGFDSERDNSSGGNGLFDMFDSASPYLACECKDPAETPLSSLMRHGVCYFKESVNTGNYTHALDSCNSSGGMHLAKFTNLVTYGDVAGYYMGNSSSMWTGANNSGGASCSSSNCGSGLFTWSDDGTPVALNFTFNANVNGSINKCVRMDSDGVLRDANCSSSSSWLCQHNCPQSGIWTNVSRECVAVSTSPQGPVLVQVPCARKAFFACMTEQTMAPYLYDTSPNAQVVLPLTRHSGAEDLVSNPVTVTAAINVGFEDLYTDFGLQGSALIGFGDPAGLTADSVVDVYLPAEFFSATSNNKGGSFAGLVWVSASQDDLVGKKTIMDFRNNTMHNSKLYLSDGALMFQLHDVGNPLVIHTVGGMDRYSNWVSGDWHFLGVTFDSGQNEGFLFVDDKVQKFGFPNSAVFDFGTNSPYYRLALGGDTQDRNSNFRGKMSCLQVFNVSLDPTQVQRLKNCSLGADSPPRSLCLDEEARYYEGVCYSVGSRIATFADAEVMCMDTSATENPGYRSQLMWAGGKRLHHDFAARIVNETFGRYDYWLGLDIRDGGGGGMWQDSFGDRVIYGNDSLWANGSPGPNTCAMVAQRDGGYISSAPCNTLRPFVCSRAPVNSPPDNPCPQDYYPYKSACVGTVFGKASDNYLGAQMSCAASGGSVYAPKDAGQMAFFSAFAASHLKADTWLGLSNHLHMGYFDATAAFGTSNPLLTDTTGLLMYSDLTPFNFSIDYRMGLTVFKDECYYLKSTSYYQTQGSYCNWIKAFACQWKAPQCPAGFSAFTTLSDGITCVGLTSATTTVVADTNMCESEEDDLRRPALPTSVTDANQLRSVGSGPTWIGMSFNNDTFSVNYDPTQYNDPSSATNVSQIMDMAWGDLPWVDRQDQEGNETNCVLLGSNGILLALDQDSCQSSFALQPLCEYKACFTQNGQQCVFPFTLPVVIDRDGTTDNVTFKSCSSAYSDSPWCPTVMNGDTIVMWDYCLSDCPGEEPEIKCEEDPDFPALANSLQSAKAVNFTTDYESSDVFPYREFDMVTFECPNGFHFSGSQTTTAYAICHATKWVLSYNSNSACVPSVCSCPPWFPNNTVQGTYDWSVISPPYCYLNHGVTDFEYGHMDYEDVKAEESRLSTAFGEKITYSCPTGFRATPNSEEDSLVLECDTFAAWAPNDRPLCTPEPCLLPPYQVANTTMGFNNWNSSNMGNGGYLSIVNYFCPRSGWGYPSNGLSNQSSVCQLNRVWSLPYVENCIRLPCSRRPPLTPISGWNAYRPLYNQYRCQLGYEFNGSLAFAFSNCSAAGTWVPAVLPPCVKRQCPIDPPENYIYQDKDWPMQSRDLGTKVVYTCPFSYVTDIQKLKGGKFRIFFTPKFSKFDP